MSHRLIEVNDLNIFYKRHGVERHILSNVSFYIDEGEVLGLVGESGSGKSLTSMAIMGLLPETMRVEGSIRFEGTELLSMSSSDLRRVRGGKIGMVFQDPLTSLNPFYTVGQQISEALRAHADLSKKECRAAAIELLRAVDIPNPDERVDQYPSQFSGGMRQRVMIAIAISCQPKMIIADEATTALDVTIQAGILKLLESLRNELNIGMLFITHDLAVVSQVAHRILVLRDGQEVENGTTEEIFTRPTSAYTRALLDSVPKINPPAVL